MVLESSIEGQHRTIVLARSVEPESRTAGSPREATIPDQARCFEDLSDRRLRRGDRSIDRAYLCGYRRVASRGPLAFANASYRPRYESNVQYRVTAGRGKGEDATLGIRVFPGDTS